MPEYIDKEKLIRDLIDNRSFYPAIVKNAIEDAPTEDVVPRSEYEKLEREFKVLDIECERLEKVEENFHKAKTDVAREIFEELKAMTEVHEYHDAEFGFWTEQFVELSIEDIADLEKKYIGEHKNG